MRHTPYGYDIVDGQAVINESEAAVLREIYRRYLYGISLRQIAADAGLKMCHTGIANLLKNRKYLGTGYYPKIIEPKIYDDVQAEMYRRAKRLGRLDRVKPKQKAREVPKAFHFKEAKESFTDPFQQAQYMYGLIESEVG